MEDNLGQIGTRVETTSYLACNQDNLFARKIPKSKSCSLKLLPISVPGAEFVLLCGR